MSDFFTLAFNIFFCFLGLIVKQVLSFCQILRAQSEGESRSVMSDSARTLEWEPFSSPGGLPDPGIEPRAPALQVDSLPAEPQGSSREYKGIRKER